MNKIVLIRKEKYQEKSRFGLLIQDNKLYLVVGQNAGLSKTQTSLLFLLADDSSTMNCSSALLISDEYEMLGSHYFSNGLLGKKNVKYHI